MTTSGSEQFDLLKSSLASDSQLRAELEYALAANVARVNPTDRANRFGSGAAVEWILAAVAYNAGVLSAPAGHNANGFDLRDLRDKAKGLWSVKNTTRRSDFRLSNGMGGSGRGFVDPVILLSPDLPGITFADPSIHIDLASKARDNGDAVILPFTAVLEFANNHPECVAVCHMPINDGTGQDDPWMDYVRSLLDPVRFPKLAKMFKDAAPVQTSIIDAISRLAALRDSGAITQEQFDAALTKL
jgi:hypothetical protein